MKRQQQTAKSKPGTKSVQTDEVRIEMIRQGINCAGLAARAGYSRAGMSAQISKSFPSYRARFAVEAALGYVPIWSDKKTVRARERCQKLLGFDPFLITFRELRAHARALSGQWPPADRSKRALADLIFAHLAARPKSLTHQTTSTENAITTQ